MGKAGVNGLAKLIVALAIGGAMLGACSTREYLDVNRDGDHTALPARGTPPAPPPPPRAVAGPRPDQCGAASLQYLVGKQKTEIPVPNDPSRRRVVCTTCPMTRDYRPDRQTILYDEASKQVTSVTCG